MMLNFLEKLLHLPNYNWSNFDTNPTVDLRETINSTKVQRLHYDYLLHPTPFYSSFIFSHNLSINTSHTQELTTLLPLHSPFPFPFPFPFSHTHNALFLGEPPWPLELVPLVQWELRNPFAPINDFLILQGPMRFWEWISIQLKLGWESLGPMKHKRDSIL